MLISLYSKADPQLAVSGKDVVRLFYPDARLQMEQVSEADLVLTVSSYDDGQAVLGQAELKTATAVLTEKASAQASLVADDEGNHRKRLVKLALYRVLSSYTGGSPSPWGILTGIRPTKIVHRLLDEHRTVPEITAYLQTNYDMAHDKADLLIRLALLQRRYLLPMEEATNYVSIYIGIPFCPTRCSYCSFPAYPVEGAGTILEPFLDALRKEIKSIGRVLTEQGKRVQTVYIGGGTPTVLDSRQLASLLETVQEALCSSATAELTLEAGRPDTITPEKLKTALALGVTRLSINPQSMNQATLQTIGRRHTPEMIRESIELARQTGFRNINMDIIVGLPRETVSDVEKTLAQIRQIRPENLTVHTLAVKRASYLKENKDKVVLAAPQDVVVMQELAAEAAQAMGMHPYYLYRQKMMVSPLENIGYALEGFDCLYNIQMIEERQTIIGLGCGAGSKFVIPGTWYLTSLYNPKDPAVYISRIDEMVARKVDKLASFG